MTATKLNPAAAPFPCPYPYYAHHLAPAPPPPFPLPGACPPTLPLVTYSYVLSPQGRLGFYLPVRQYSSPPVPRKGVSAAPHHGRLPSPKVMAAFSGPCGAGKRQAAAPPVASAAAARAQVPRKPRQEAGSRSHAVAPRQKAESRRSQAVAPRPRKAAGPRARLAAQREAPPPPSLYTKRPLHWVKPKPSELGECTTIMLRNIPNKLR